MTALFTCAYRAYRPEMGQAVVSSLGLPKWREAEAKEWPRCWEITPRGSYFHATREEFDRQYLAQLDRFGARRIAQRFAAITRQTGATSLVVMCFEPAGIDVPANCHRTTWAAWWLATTGEQITELPGAPAPR